MYWKGFLKGREGFLNGMWKVSCKAIYKAIKWARRKAVSIRISPRDTAFIF